MDNQEYNFADESPEVISTVPTDILIEDAVPEPLISLNVYGHTESKPENLFSNDKVSWFSYCEYANGIYRQTAADTSTTPYFKIYFPSETKGTSLKRSDGESNIKKFTLPETVSATFTTSADSNYFVLAVNGSTFDSGMDINIPFKAGTTIKVSVRVLNNVQGEISWDNVIVEGIEPTPSTPYEIKSVNSGPIEISVHSRQLFNINGSRYDYPLNIATAEIRENRILEMSSDTSSGYVFARYHSIDNKDYFDTYLRISYNLIQAINFQRFYIEIKHVSPNNITTNLGRILTTNTGYTTGVLNNRTPKYEDGARIEIDVVLVTTDNASFSTFTVSDIMLERGSTATEYQPYFRDTVEVPVSSGIVLRSLGDVSDELIVENGTVKNIQRITPFTTPEWNEFYLNDTSLTYYNRNVYQIALYNSETDPSRYERSLSTEDNSIGLCSHFKNISFRELSAEFYRANYYGTEPLYKNVISIIEDVLVIYKDNESLEDFVQWWNANKDNIKIYYALQNPIETDITNTPVGQQLLQLSTERGLNTMHIIADVNPSEIKTKYWKQIR